MVSGDFWIIISLPLGMVAMRESNETKWFSSRPETFNLIIVSSEITKGRAFRLCGAIGVNTKDLVVGAITGPPQLSEYPVEPVGVAIIKPSAQ